MRIKSLGALLLVLTLLMAARSACMKSKPTATPVPTPSFAETGAAELAPRLQSVCASAVQTTTQTITSGAILVAWADSGQANVYVQKLLRDSVQPHSEADLAFVACLARSEVALDLHYTDGSRAYRVDYSVKLVLYPDAEIVDQQTVMGSAPGKYKVSGASTRGPEPTAQTAYWVAERMNTGVRGALGLHWGLGNVCWSPDGRTVASAGDSTVRLWATDVGQRIGTLVGHDRLVYDVAWSPDGQTLASGGQDTTLRLWDAASQRELAHLEHPQWVKRVAWSPDGRTVAAASGDQVYLWDVATRQQIATYVGHTQDVLGVAFSPDGKMLATASKDETVRLWDAGSGQPVGTLSGHKAQVTDVAWHPDGKMLASTSWDGTVRLWNTDQGQEMATLSGGEGEYVTSVAWSPDGKMLAAGSSYSRIRLWQTQHVTTAVPTHKEDMVLAGHSSWVSSLEFSPDGTRLASGGDDRTIRLWDVASGQLIEW